MKIWPQNSPQPLDVETNLIKSPDRVPTVLRDAQTSSLATRRNYEGSFGSWPCKNGLIDIDRSSQDPGVSQATIAAINGLTPTMFMTRVRL